jgi:hypothetical protein
MGHDYTIFQLDLLSPSTDASLKLDACESGHFPSGRGDGTSGRRRPGLNKGGGLTGWCVWSRRRRRGFGLLFKGCFVPEFVGVVVVVVESLASHHCTSRLPLVVDADSVVFSGICGKTTSCSFSGPATVPLLETSSMFLPCFEIYRNWVICRMSAEMPRPRFAG